MAIRVHFVGGGSVTVQSETVRGFREDFGRAKGDYSWFEQERVLIVHAHVTHVEDLDETPMVE